MGWRMGVGVGMVAGAVMEVGVAMAEAVLGVGGVRQRWGDCILEVIMGDMDITGSIIGITREVGVGRGGLMRAGVRGRRSMIEKIDDADEVCQYELVSGISCMCGLISLA